MIDSVTVILTVWRRNNLEEQLNSILGQTHPPTAIWVYRCGECINIERILVEYPQVQLINSSVNLGYYGRFSVANHVDSEYVWILDDDVIPAPTWIENSIQKSRAYNAVIASAGRIIPVDDFQPEHLRNVNVAFVGDVSQGHPFNYCNLDTRVDFGCNSWFFRTDWIRAFWKSYPYSFATGEDIHLSASLKLNLGVATVVPQQLTLAASGNQKKAYGYDEHASWVKPEFLIAREKILKHMIIDSGWKPLLW